MIELSYSFGKISNEMWIWFIYVTKTWYVFLVYNQFKHFGGGIEFLYLLNIYFQIGNFFASIICTCIWKSHDNGHYLDDPGLFGWTVVFLFIRHNPHTFGRQREADDELDEKIRTATQGCSHWLRTPGKYRNYWRECLAIFHTVMWFDSRLMDLQIQRRCSNEHPCQAFRMANRRSKVTLFWWVELYWFV